MRVAILGSGVVGRTLATKFSSIGHEVTIGCRDVEALLAKPGPGPRGEPAFRDWQAEHPTVRLATFSDASAGAEIVFNATNGSASLSALELAGADNLRGKILVDLSNPLDFSGGFPPFLSIVNTDSLGEQVQGALPDTRVVKTLNTVGAEVMVDPGAVNGGNHHLFLSGNDAAAKAEVETILREWLGWTHVLDLGDITTARGPEMYLALWTRMMGAVGRRAFNIQVVS